MASPPAVFARRLAFSRKPPGEMPLAHMSAITPTEVLRWPYPRHQEAGRWEKKPETKRLDQLVHDAYTTPVGHWKFFHSRSTSNSAPPHAPPCGREAPQGRTDRREHVVARSVEEGIRVLETHHCRDLDFTNHAVMSHKDVCALQAPFREDDAKADYSRTATTHALVVRRALPNEQRDREQEHEDAQAIKRLQEVQAPAVKLLKLIAGHTTLHTLRIDCKNLGEEAFCCLAASLEENSSLRILDCSSNYLTPHAAGLLGFSLRKHPLEELYLDFCTVGLSLFCPPQPAPPSTSFFVPPIPSFFHTQALSACRSPSRLCTHTHECTHACNAPCTHAFAAQTRPPIRTHAQMGHIILRIRSMATPLCARSVCGATILAPTSPSHLSGC
eukprot:Tamp_06225.p1 GENE.Tamp_06225~~Tamp_06225.p1  ORF type:complete len:439 (-),score=57.43 Tamp_06225:1449-2606(-)